MNPEHHYIVKQAQGPLCALLTLFLGNTRLKVSYPTFLGTAPLKVPDQAVPIPSHPNTRFPLHSVTHQSEKPFSLYECLLGASVNPSVATSVLTLGVVAQMEVSGLESDWEALRLSKQSTWEWSVVDLTPIGCGLGGHAPESL